MDEDAITENLLAICHLCSDLQEKETKKYHDAGTRIRTWVTAATTQCPNH